jgi:hypothetical protein
MMESEQVTAAVLDGEWLTLEEAARLSGKSPSTIERRAAEGRLRSKLEPRARRKPERLYRAEDVEQLKAASGIHAVSETAIGAAGQQHLTFAYLLQELLRRNQPPPLPAPAPLPWITLQEAAESIGLAAGFLRREIKAGKIAANRGGPHGALRIHRASLEAYR